MRQTLNAIYRRAAEEFARRVTSCLGGQVDSIVLYGSVARGDTKRASDVDVLVISPDPAAVKDRISAIRSDLSYESNFAFFISLVQLSRAELLELVRLGSPFAWDIVREAIGLYDNGTFSRIRRQALAAS